ncbi:GNAT family N-acetyltransferase [Erwinia sp. P6884]|uniref:GNAT family N-acetyltransferase n=1 Tax=Erwinia sp. P6884 TaxID=3141450 RepID=UPI003197C1A2
MPLQTERLCCRAVRPSDVETLFTIYGDPATNVFNPAGPYTDSHQAASVLKQWMAHWTERGCGNWAISLHSEPGKIIGFGGISVRRCAGSLINNLGYRFATQAWGKGVATEFSQAAIHYGFNDLRLDDISAVVRPNHFASQNVLLKSGMSFSKEVHDVENAPPSLLFTLTRDEWSKNAT